MNTLIRKRYLLAVVIMAANMFVVNEMKAMNASPFPTSKKTMSSKMNQPSISPKNINTLQKNGEGEGNQVVHGAKSEPNIMDKVLSKILSCENLINFIGGAVFSGANNYFKWWDYNPGKYRQFGCRGWRSKRFLNGMLQFDINFVNLGRGAFWLLPGAYIFIKGFTKEETGEDYCKNLHVSWLVTSRFLGKGSPFVFITSFIVVFLFQGFVSIPLTLHFSKFSISISLDSIIWGVIGFFLDDKEEQPNKKNPNEKTKMS